jgi:hypothetical protein
MHGVDYNHFTEIKVREPVKLAPASGIFLDESVAGGFGVTFEVLLLKSTMLSICSLSKTCPRSSKRMRDLNNIKIHDSPFSLKASGDAFMD